MNRQRKRELERKYGPDFAMQKYRDEVMEEGIQQGMKMAIDTILYMTCYTLNYKLGLGKKRLPEIMYHIVDNIDAYNTGHLTPEDFIEIKKQMNDLGFSLEEHYKKRKK